jgi:hypothetical protein
MIQGIDRSRMGSAVICPISLCKALDMNGVPWAKPKGGYIGEIFGQPGSQ